MPRFRCHNPQFFVYSEQACDFFSFYKLLCPAFTRQPSFPFRIWMFGAQKEENFRGSRGLRMKKYALLTLTKAKIFSRLTSFVRCMALFGKVSLFSECFTKRRFLEYKSELGWLAPGRQESVILVWPLTGRQFPYNSKVMDGLKTSSNAFDRSKLRKGKTLFWHISVSIEFIMEHFQNLNGSSKNKRVDSALILCSSMLV